MFEIKSNAFENGQDIPSKYTCQGKDVSPPLWWKDAPEGTKSYALLVDDPDAPDPKNPQKTWVHWVVYNIPASVQSIKEAASKSGFTGLEGLNDFKRIGYGGPCPPKGNHRYFFKLYALDEKLDLEPGKTKKEILASMQGHILGEAQLMGKYHK